MVTLIKNSIVFFLLALISAGELFAGSNDSVEIYSELNKVRRKVNSHNFSFLVTAHIHGSSNSQSGMPAASIMANLDLFRSSELSFCVSLGDLFLNVERDFKNYEKYFLNKIPSPLYNSVGNHDVDNDIYIKRYGKTYQTFDVGSNRFIILDSELDNGDIKGEQLEMLTKSLHKNHQIENVFIFMHRTLWAENDEQLSELFEGNTRSAVSSNFNSEVLPLIKKASENFHFYIFSGSMGGNAPSSFFYHSYSENVKFIATAVRDLPRDAVLKVTCNKNKISFSTFSLNSNQVLPLEKYTVSWWQNNKPQPPGFNWRLVPLYIWQMITHRFFWYGVFYMLIPMIVLFLIFRRKYRAKKT